MIYPRSPREMMAGWVHLPRFIDKIRLHLAGQLPTDYQANFTKGFDGLWLKAAGIQAETFLDVVKNAVTDGQVCDWVCRNVKTGISEKNSFNQYVLNRGRDGDLETRERLENRKKELGLAERVDIQTFVDMIDADEKRI